MAEAASAAVATKRPAIEVAVESTSGPQNEAQGTDTLYGAILRLQRSAGNRAVSSMLQPMRVTVQRHSSFEHRLLGDAPPGNLAAIASRVDPARRQHVLQEERDRLRMWQRDPTSITQAQIEARWPGVRVIRLRNGLFVTYGEMNTLGDYLSGPGQIDNASVGVLLPILQMVREQGYNRLVDLLGDRRMVPTGRGVAYVPAHEQFDEAIGPHGDKGTMASIGELRDLNRVTSGLGTDRYQALVARNACHFAPYSWHRWEDSHTIARDLARRGQSGGDRELVRQAWVNNGYADHFLQDSFAAGHLINKTRVMQLFVQWIQEHNSQGRWDRLWSSNRSMWNIDIENWEQIRTMTPDQQPGISGSQLYGRGTRAPGSATDPQTAEEGPTREDRMTRSGVRATGRATREQAYQAYLAFMNSSVVQAGSGALHDYFNERSLTVGSPAHPAGFQIWGDETLVTSGDGVRIAAETARMSQQAIEELTTTGQTSVTIPQIRDQFPDRVQAAGGQMLSLENWNNSDQLHRLLWETVFPDVHYRIVDTFGPTMGRISQDMVQSGGGERERPAPAAVRRGTL
jgi:hypothetical protein